MDILNKSYFVNGRFQYKTPYFNPNNSDEFVYNYIDFEEKEFKLMKYTISTQEHIELAEDVRIISQPKWSNKNWIAFDNIFQFDYGMNVVKSDGTERRKVSSDKHNLYPAWANGGETLYWSYHGTLGTRPIYFLKQNINSATVDTVFKYTTDENTGSAVRSEISKNNYLTRVRPKRRLNLAIYRCILWKV
ncbi:MAG: hypothetical protein ACPG44_08745 [Polaribacter sp.]